MTKIQLQVFSLIVLSICIHASSIGAQNLGATFLRKNAVPELRLSTTIDEQHYCFDGYFYRLALTLRFTFTNVGVAPLILDKKSSVFDRVYISRSLPVAAAKKYFSESILTYDLRTVGVSKSEPDESSFVILQPNESHRLSKEISLELYDREERSKQDLRGGDYFLQLRVWTWYYWASPGEYRQQWKDKGYLWSKSITSVPMPFKVEVSPEFKPCILDKTAAGVPLTYLHDFID